MMVKERAANLPVLWPFYHARNYPERKPLVVIRRFPMTYDNSNPNKRPMPPTPTKPNRAMSPTTWILGAVAVVVVLGIAAFGLTGTDTTPNNASITSTPNTTGTAPATPPSTDANKTDIK